MPANAGIFHSNWNPNGFGNMDQSTKKLNAAKAALEYIQDGVILGVGTGSTVNILIDLLPAIRNKIEAVVSSSVETKTKLEQYDFKVSMLNEVGDIDLYTDKFMCSTCEDLLAC